MTQIDLGQHYPIKTDTLPNTWVVGYVGDFANNIQAGFACGLHGRGTEGIAHLRPMNVSREGALDLSDVKKVDPNFNDKRLMYGDVLFNNTNSPELVGKTTFVADDGNGLAFSNHMTQVRVGTGVSAKFLSLQLHHLWAQKYFFHRCVKHVNQASISSTELAKRIPFVCPPANEQRRIVARIEALFDEIDHGVENLKKAKATLGLYRQSLLKAAFEGRLTADWRAQNPDKLEDPEILLARIQKEREARYQSALDDWQKALADWRTSGEKGKKPAKPRAPSDVEKIKQHEIVELESLPDTWSWIRLGDLFWQSSKNGVYKPASDYGTGVSIIRIDDFYDGRLVRTAGFKRLRLNDEEQQQYQVAPGELLINRVNSLDYLGKCAETPDFDEVVVYESNIMKCHPISERSSTGWIARYLSGQRGRDRIRKHAKHAVNQASINQTDVALTPIPVCSPEEQAEITRVLDERLSAADALEAEIDAGLTRAEALRQSILKQAFSGKLVPQDPNDEPASVLLERIKAEKAKAPKAKRKRKATA